VRKQLDEIVDEMLDKGILYDEARREFDRRFIARALLRPNGSLTKLAKRLGMHRNTLSRKLAEYRTKRRP
jgi:DNA-binding NtrC family response regulator